MVQYSQKNAMGYSTHNIILNIQQEQYHVVCHMSGIVFIHYACRKSELYTF